MPSILSLYPDSPLSPDFPLSPDPPLSPDFPLSHDFPCPISLLYSTSKTTGLIQLIPDAVSIDGLKKKAEYPGSLRKHFEQVSISHIDFSRLYLSPTLLLYVPPRETVFE
jgi:hypothetical protein